MVASGDAIELVRRRESCSWFPNQEMIFEEAFWISISVTEEERARMMGENVIPIDITHWAMVEGKSMDPGQHTMGYVQILGGDTRGARRDGGGGCDGDAGTGARDS